MRKVSDPYRKGNDKGYWLRWRDPATNKPITRRFPTKKLASHYQHIIYQQLNADVFIGAIDYPWIDAKTEFLARYDMECRPSTKKEAERFLKRFEEYCHPCGTRTINQALVDHYFKCRKKVSENPYTLNKDIERCRTLLNWLYKKRYSVARIELQKLKTPPPATKALTDHQIVKLLAACPHPEWQLRIIVALCTGLRKMDLYRLPKIAVDLREGRIDTTQAKTLKPFTSPLPDALIKPLRNYLKTVSNDHRFFWDVYNQQWLDKQFRNFRPPGVTIQSLRKTYSTRIEATGISTIALSHSSAAVTRQFYNDMDYIKYIRVNQLPVDKWLKIQPKKPD